jgi:hypothetical protein
MSIRELYQEDMPELGPGPDAVCGWPGCEREPLWEVVYEDLLTAESVAVDLFGDKIESADRRLQDRDLVASQFHHYYCDVHARQFCLEGKVELPMKLAS